MLVGKTLGPYVVEKELGSGAMGTVFRGRHSTTKAKVAIKLISPAVASSETALARFTREITILKQLDHPNIVRYKGSGRFHGSPFFVMEYVGGESLDKVMARRGRMTWEEVGELGEQLCAALQHAHEKGIVHRDLKPSNIMVLPDGTVKLTDFGIAKDIDVTALTGANATVGTAAYMSPEQCRGARDITARSDLYSLGIMFYELITGRKPFMAETAMDMFLKHANGEFTRPSKLVLDMPVWLDTLICQLMEKKPEQRPHSAEAVSQALAMVREKVQAQTSAGVDAAKKRRVDRTKRDVALDETDKDAARSLLGKKKKKKTTPIYQQGWFTIAALGLIGVVMAGLFWLIFLKAPSAASLYAQAQALRQAGQKKEARDGPIKEFLEYHPDDARAKEVQIWADQYDTEIAEKQVLRRYSGTLNLDPEHDTEKAVREALDLEKAGKLTEAEQRWKDVAVHKTSKDPDLRPYGLVAAKRARDLAEVDRLAKRLGDVAHGEALLPGEKRKVDSAAEGFALDALRKEEAKKDALEEWKVLREFAQSKSDEPDMRPYFLLAQKKLNAAAVAQKEQKK